MLILIVILYIFWLPPCSLRWEESSSHEKMEIHLSFLISVKKKKSISSSQNQAGLLWLMFLFALFSPALPALCLFFLFRLFWVICWHNSVRSLGFEETWTRSPGTQRFLSDNTTNTPPADFLYSRHNIFKHQFAKQVGCEYSSLLVVCQSWDASLHPSDSWA